MRTEVSGPTAEQLRRLAVVYVRQSSPGQVIKNTESRELQYEFTQRALALGWHRDQVVVIDEDLGRRASEGGERGGFQRLVAEVGLGHVGLVLGTEVSRLARRNADWYNLMDLCALTDTLIADSDGVYHPADFNSRLLLGLKGNMAEAELHLLRQRLTNGKRHKAAKGTLRVVLPVGLDYGESDAVVLSANESVRAAIGDVFARFARLTSARQVVLSLRADDLALPYRRPGATRVRWAPATYRAVREILINPAYAGAFVFGRQRVEKSVAEDGRIIVRRRQVPREQWEVCILGHHPGYVDWDTYLENQRRLAANRRVAAGGAGGAPREGSALLQGLVRCGRCGRRMQVAYWGSSGKRPAYTCAYASTQLGDCGPCQRISGRRVDEVVLEAVFAVLEPASLQMTAKALCEVQAHHERELRAFETALERAQYEAERARRQFDAVEPENRLVARSVEAEWESRLLEVASAEAALEDRRARRPLSLTAEELAWLDRAGADLRAVFHAPSTTTSERKQLLRTLLTEVIVTVNMETRDAAVRICFEGGATLERIVPPPRTGNVRATDEDTIALVRRLAVHYSDMRIAQILSRQGRTTATGLRFTRERVKDLRHKHSIPAANPGSKDDDSDATIMTLSEAERALGMSTVTLYRWLRQGFIAGTQLTPGGPWHIRIDSELRAKIVPDVPAGWVGLKEAARTLGVARQTVLDRIRRGELRAVHVKRGRRSGLAIEITSQSESATLFR